MTCGLAQLSYGPSLYPGSYQHNDTMKRFLLSTFRETVCLIEDQLEQGRFQSYADIMDIHLVCSPDVFRGLMAN